MNFKLVIIIILLIIIFLLHIRQNEYFNDDIYLYNDNTNTVNLNYLDISGNLNVKGDISSNFIVAKNIKNINNINISGNLIITGDISGNFNKKYIRAQYVQIGNGTNNITEIGFKDNRQIAEIVVIDDTNTNVALDIVPTLLVGGRSILNQNLINETTDGIIEDNNYYYAQGGENLIEINLGKEKNLTQINIFGRYANIKTLDGTYIKLLDKDKKEVKLILTGRWDNIFSKEFIL